MSKRKGLSLEDKRKVILSVYHDKKEPFNLKEIETIASRMGVVQQTIKDVNQSLVDDFLVLSDKIGAANFFWSFPSKAYQDLSVQNDRLTTEISQFSSRITEKKSLIVSAKLERTAPNRESKLDELTKLLNEEDELNKQLESLKRNDPDEICKIVKMAEVNREGANRWTDNTWTLKTYLTKRKGLAPKEADKFLKIDSSFDYVEYSEPKLKKQK